MVEITNELMYETLKKVQAGVADLRNAIADTRQDVRGVKDEIISLRTIMGEFIKTDARRETNTANLATRIERIERRLDLQDNPN